MGAHEKSISDKLMEARSLLSEYLYCKTFSKSLSRHERDAVPLK